MWRNTSIYYFCFTLLVAGSHAASYNAYQYDATGAQFTPDGRLLQVEYASAAADHSSPVIVVPMDSDLCLVCTTRRAGSTERLVLVPTGSLALTTTTTHEQSPPIVVALSGILADNMALLEAVQEKRLKQLQLYETPLSAQQVAQAIADQCQMTSFGGGIRPFGATMLVCGIDGMYKTDSSGAIASYCKNRLQEARRQPTVVVGGSANSARALKRRIASVLATKDDDVRKRIKEIISIVRSEQTKTEESMELEVVLISKTRGVLKLKAKQIAELF